MMCARRPRYRYINILKNIESSEKNITVLRIFHIIYDSWCMLSSNSWSFKFRKGKHKWLPGGYVIVVLYPSSSILCHTAVTKS